LQFLNLHYFFTPSNILFLYYEFYTNQNLENMSNAKTSWVLDPTHSEVQFKVKHLMITNVTGSFTSYDVKVETEGIDFATASINFSANVASISTANEQRDAHLKSADFFDAEKFATISFVATKYADEKLTGNLTIKDVTKSVTLDVDFGGISKDPWGNAKAGFSVSGKINRKDFGLGWNAPLETGGVLVSEEVKINCEIQLVKQA
jgi:polyisoprenoid-binding protein YceI